MSIPLSFVFNNINIGDNVLNNNSSLNIDGNTNIASNKYISVPNDSSLTNFYKLGIDSNFNITPTI